MVTEVKGASIKFISFQESVPKLLGLLKLQRELSKYDKIVLKPYVANPLHESTSREFLEEVLKFVLANKNPVAEVFIAEGADGESTTQLFEALGYDILAEKYDVSLVDLNMADVEVVQNYEFLKFEEIFYPKLLNESFIISVPKLGFNEEFGVMGSMANMVGAFPAEHYKGFFSRKKNKIRKWPVKYTIHDMMKCKLPDFAVVDAAEQGAILAGLPLEIDKQGAKLMGREWKDVPYIRLVDESFSESVVKSKDVEFL